MSLSVVHGPFEALEEEFAERIRALAPGPGAPPALVVAPSRVLLDRLERLLAVEKGLALAGVHLVTFRGLATALVEEGGMPGGALVADPAFHDAVVDRVLDRAAALGFARELRPRALASAVRASLRDLLDAGVDPGQVAEHFGSELLRDPREAERLNGLLALLAAYDRELQRLGVLSPAALVRRAAELAPASAWLGRFREVLYYGAYDFTGLQLELFDGVTGARPTTLYFPHRVGHPAFRFGEQLFEQKLAGRSPRRAEAPRAASALGPALDALFDPAGRPVPPEPGRVRLVSASGASDEAWAAAKEAARLAEEGVPLAEIAVVARSLEPYRRGLARAFAAEGLPLDLGCGEPILRQPLAKAALDLLSLRRRDFPARAIEDVAGSPYFHAAAPPRVARWRRLIAGLGIRAGWLQWRGKLESRLSGDIELRPQRVAEGRQGELVPREDAVALWETLSGLREALGTPPASWSRRAAEARALLDAHLRAPRDASSGERDAWAAVDEAIEELAGFERLGEPCSWEQFLDALERKLARAERPAGDGRLGVRALDAMDARGHRFRAVILLGLKEKLFPGQVSEDPLLRDAARAALRHPAGYWIARKAARHEEERLLFYLCVASARERLVLVYPRSDEDGKAAVPSSYLRELCRAAALPSPGEADSWRVPRPPAERLRGLAAERRTPREAALLAALEGGRPDPALFGADPGAEALDAALGRAAALVRGGAPGPHDGLVRPPAPELAAWRASGLSPSALDDYARCPFSFFAERVLGLSERDEGGERDELSVKTRGIVYHAALERYHAALADSAGSRWEVELDRALESVFAENDWRKLGLYPLLWEAARRDMSARLRAFAAWERTRAGADAFRPARFEAELRGAPAGGAPGDIPWRGRLDRMDVDERDRRFRVIDYKTRASQRRASLSKKVAAGDTHQLPFYIELAAGALGEGWTFAGGELLFIEAKEDKDRSAALTPEDWASARPFFLERLARRVETIAAGRFPIRPKDGEQGYCMWCEFDAMCRKAHGPSRARAARVEAP